MRVRARSLARVHMCMCMCICECARVRCLLDHALIICAVYAVLGTEFHAALLTHTRTLSLSHTQVCNAFLILLIISAVYAILGTEFFSGTKEPCAEHS